MQRRQTFKGYICNILTRLKQNLYTRLFILVFARVYQHSHQNNHNFIGHEPWALASGWVTALKPR